MRSWNTTHLIGKLVDCISKSGTSGISQMLLTRVMGAWSILPNEQPNCSIQYN